MQNSIIREFEDHPEVVVAALQEAGRQSETLAWAKTYWSNWFLRDFEIIDPSGTQSTIILCADVPSAELAERK